MDIKELRGLMEAYQQVNAPEQLDEVLDTPEKANEYARKNVRSMLGAFAKGVANKDISQLKTIEKRKRGAELGKRKAERKAAEEQKESFDIFDVVLEFLQVEGYAETLEEAEWIMANELDSEDIEAILEAEGSYGETPKAYSAALKTKMTAKRKPFLKAMQRRTNPANRKDAYASPRKGMTASDREEARAGAAYGSPRGHDYPSQGPGSVTKNPKKLRKQKAIGEID